MNLNNGKGVFASRERMMMMIHLVPRVDILEERGSIPVWSEGSVSPQQCGVPGAAWAWME